MTNSGNQAPPPIGTHLSARMRLGASELYLLFATVIGLPMVINFFRFSSSVSLGTTLAGLLALSIQLIHGVPRRMVRQIVLVSTGIGAFVAVHLLLAAQLWQVDLMRGLGSILVLAICIAGGIAIANLLSCARPDQLTAAIRRFTQIFLFLGIWGGLGLTEYMTHGIKP